MTRREPRKDDVRGWQPEGESELARFREAVKSQLVPGDEWIGLEEDFLERAEVAVRTVAREINHSTTASRKSKASKESQRERE